MLVRWPADPAAALWRRHSDAVNRDLLERWWPRGPVGRVLKTDAWDEGVGEGLVGLMAERAEEVVVIDVARATLDALRARRPDVQVEEADVRALPFAAGTFDVVVSNSTLDHFDDRADLHRGLGELARVLAPGGTLLVTLDNLLNPIVAVRTTPPTSTLLRRAGLVPYHLGRTLGPRGLRHALEGHGLRVQAVEAVMHAPPRVLAGLAGRRPPERYLPRVLAAERLGRWPTRYLTGHFVAARAVRP